MRSRPPTAVAARPLVAVPVAALMVGLLVSGCSGGHPAAAPPTRSTAPGAPVVVPRLTASATQYTVDEASGNLRIAVTNVGHGTVTVTSAALDWPGFDSAPVPVQGGTLRPGESAGLLTLPGRPKCATPPSGRPHLAVVADGTTRLVPLTVQVPGLLEMLYRRACGAQRLAQTVGISLVPGSSPVVIGGQQYLPGDLVLRRSAGATAGVTVIDLYGSVLFTFAPRQRHGELPARLAPDRAVVRLPVLLGSADRCDPHARGNSSQTFVFNADVREDGQVAQRVIVTPDAATQVTLLAILAHDCR